MLRVAEIFESIQGESTHAGLPCGFVRLAGCNLSCAYCDTPGAQAGGQALSVDAAAERVTAFGHALVEVTGGEPLLQDDCVPLVARLLDGTRTVLVETNGTRDISVLPAGAIRIVDIKTPGSGFADKVQWEHLEHLGPRDEVKFVLTSRADYEWARESVSRVRDAGATTILFSPARDTLDAASLADWLLADRLNVRLQIQLHRVIGRP